MIASGALGKKIFFLYPPPVLTDIVDELARREFEVYLARDHGKLKRILAADPDALVFVNLDDGMDEPSWVSWIDGLKKDEKTAGVGVGVMTTIDRPAVEKSTYLLDLQVACGFVVLKIGLSKATEIIVKTLEANEARGKRKFVRAACPPGSGTGVIPIGDSNLQAQVLDLSVAGTAVAIEGDTAIKAGTMLKGMLLTIKGNRLPVSGFVAAQRPDATGRLVHVIMFDPGSLTDTLKEKIRSTVFKVNQASFERLMEST